MSEIRPGNQLYREAVAELIDFVNAMAERRKLDAALIDTMLARVLIQAVVSHSPNEASARRVFAAIKENCGAMLEQQLIATAFLAKTIPAGRA